MGGTALELIDELITRWNGWSGLAPYYLQKHIPMIVSETHHGRLVERELEIVRSLRQLLPTDEWRQLGELIVERQANPEAREKARRAAEEQARRELESDRQRDKALERVRRRRAEEQARLRKEHEQQIRLKQEREWQVQQQRQALEAEMARKRAVIARVQHAFEADFLSADRVFAADPDARLVSGHEYQELKTGFVQDWVSRTLQHPVDSEQAAAIAATDGDVQVVARAGSGKTRTLVARAIFLQKHCGVSARELLLLAFNKRAAEEMKNRVAADLGTNLPYAMTFHALAHALVHPEEELLFDDAFAAQFGRSRAVQGVIDEYMKSQEHMQPIQTIMLAHFREDWERIVAGRLELSMAECLANRRALLRESLRGDYVKSFGEKVIANVLFEYSVEYSYESNFPWNGVNYRPDFMIRIGSVGGIIIEYFGLDGHADYDEMSQRKRQFWATRNEWRFLEFSPRDLASRGQDGFVQVLLLKLQEAGVSCRWRTEEEIWQLVRKRALDGFTKAMQTFIGRCRKLNLSADDLRVMIERHTVASTAEARFLDVSASVYQGYLVRLSDRKKEDFEGVVWRAVAQIRSGQSQFVRDKAREHGDVNRLRFILIDEFQDFSQMFFDLVDAIRSANPQVQVFCVGDDWQAIYGFAGADLRFFEHFPKRFRNPSRYYIRTNYRSSRAVVEVGNALMHGRGPAAEPARNLAGRVLLCHLDRFQPSAAERARHKSDEITPAILRVIKHFLDRGLSVIMLSRQHRLPWRVGNVEPTGRTSDPLLQFLEHVKSCLPVEDRERVTASTTHGYKGLEESAVVILDAVWRSYPLLHPSWVFQRIFGDGLDQIEAEERRLFYVAITRAKDAVALLTDTAVESPYLGEIRRHAPLVPLSWDDLPPVPSLDGHHVKVRVSRAFEKRKQLKRLGYSFEDNGKYWHKTMPVEKFSFESLLRQLWCGRSVTIEVYSETGQLLHRR